MLTLTSADPQAQPEVRERMLSDPRDLQRLREGVRALVELARGPEAATIVAERAPAPWRRATSGCSRCWTTTPRSTSTSSPPRMGATGSRAAHDAATRPTSIHTAPAA
ncbi:GMC oxidoreductase [Nonomuraea angiospora]|uniref:GMC oxidoreductase n=1 Tax=Nonomuraea angiospora TaxID=46172 RepID=UPI0037A3DC07